VLRPPRQGASRFQSVDPFRVPGEGTRHDRVRNGAKPPYCPSPLLMQSFCIQNQVTWCASLAAIDNSHAKRCSSYSSLVQMDRKEGKVWWEGSI
jgi:hypothetical protein